MFLKRKKKEITDSEFALVKRLTSAGNDIPFSFADRVRMKAKLYQMMARTKQNIPERTHNLLSVFSALRMRTMPVVFALVVFVGMSFTAGIVRANDSKPGDTLFGLDKLLEHARLFIASDEETKLKLEISFAAERLLELEELTAEIDAHLFQATATEESTPTPLETSDETLRGQALTTTSTDDGHPADKGNTSATTDEDDDNNTPDSDESEGSPLERAIVQALSEVEGAIAKVRDNTAKLKVKAQSGETITKAQQEAFFNQVTALAEREGAVLKHLKIKTTDKKLVLKIKTYEGKKSGDSGSKDDIRSDKGENGINGRNGRDGRDGEDGSRGTDGEDGQDGSGGTSGEDGEDGDDGDDEDRGDRSNYVLLCHYPSGNKLQMQTISVSPNEADDLLAHGNTLGACPQELGLDGKRVERRSGDEADRKDDADDGGGGEEKRNDDGGELHIRLGDEELEIKGDEVDTEGLIEYVDDRLITVFGKDFVITDNTKVSIKKKRSLSVGNWAEVEGLVDGSILYAVKIKVK